MALKLLSESADPQPNLLFLSFVKRPTIRALASSGTAVSGGNVSYCSCIFLKIAYSSASVKGGLPTYIS